ncbi:hypothetical protein PAXRUDRAFT_174357 [Paxillus rubicundulus Ve08.2h10]|uniref:Uncharacterized protein n=1 Tax=Paxillus rubicundulus Ve08.2h10 TaxID=930991 RepID=A0A0D0D4K2_9AGAM|nr:hypothetical protein PAXRUDRAFT_174357 [Paxillus rubicundulus Ve08.2h10]
MNGSPGTITDARKHVSKMLGELRHAIATLLVSLPEGKKDGPLYMHLSDFSVDEEEGPYFSFNRAWELAFQRPKNEKPKLIVHGKYGLKVAHSFASHFANLNGIEAHNDLGLIVI